MKWRPPIADQTPTHAGLNLIVYPSNLIGSSRILKLATSLQSGLDVAETHAVGILSGSLPREEVVAPGVKYVRVRGSGVKGNIGRLLKLLLWQPNVYRAYRGKPVSAIAAHNVWVLPLCALLAKRTGATLVYNPHELETETVAMRGIKKRAAQMIEQGFIYRAAVRSAVNPSIAAWYEERYQLDRVVPVTNVPVDSSHKEPHLRESIGVSQDEILYIHTGHLSVGRNIPLILDAFKRVPDVHVVFVGDGVLGADVRAAAAENHNIHWLPPVPPFEVVGHVRKADVALCLMEPTSLSAQYSSANKLFEALAAPRPVLATDLIEFRRALGENGASWLVSDISTLPEQLRRITKLDAKRFADTFSGIPTWDEQVAPLVEAYRRALDDRV